MANFDEPKALSNTQQWFEIARPEPTVQELTTQIGVHFEEVGEMIAELTPEDMITNGMLLDAKEAITRLGDYLKKNPGCVHVTQENRINYLDALCDQIVTAVGCAHGEKMEIVGAMSETNRSNFSKFVDGKAIYNEDGKIMKGPDYTKPDLTPFV